MRTPKRLATGLAIVASAATLTALAASSALADPYPAGTVPALTDIVGVGSDTTTPVFSGGDLTAQNVTTGALALDYNATHAAPASQLYSWDAVDPSTGAAGGPITTKGSSPSDTACNTTRPNGSSAGIAELEKNKLASDGSSYCVDYARSSRAPASSDPSTIAFVSMAKDAITWSTPSGSPAPSTLKISDLVNIYLCNVTNWSSVGGSSAPIVPVLPQAGSGTRATFLAALGKADGLTGPLPYGSCVVDGKDSSGNPIEENTGLSTGNVNEFKNVDTVFPYSIGAYIAQGPKANGVGGHATPIWGHGVLGVRSMTDASGTVQTPTTTNNNGQVVINGSFEPELQRILYNVVRNGGTASAPAFPTTPAYEATALPAIFGPSGWICTNRTAQNDLVSYGFLSLGANCGALTAG